MDYFKLFRITADANGITYDTIGLQSSLENPVTLKSVMVQVAGYGDNDVQGYHEREKIFDIPDSLIDTDEEGSTDKISKSFNRINEIPVGLKMPPGTMFQAAIRCGATNLDLHGAYRYEITT